LRRGEEAPFKRIFLIVRAIFVPISHACSREIARYLWGLRILEIATLRVVSGVQLMARASS